MIDRYQLRYFLAVVEAGNFSRAAQRMNVTQPTLSVGVAKLEAELGARLFIRNSQRVHMTEAGARLLAQARAIESTFEAVEKQAPAAGDARLVRLGLLSTVPTRMAEAVVTGLRGGGEPLRMELIEGAERDLMAGLERGRIDLALTLVRGPAARLAHELAFTEGYGLLLSDDHPLADGEAPLSADEVAGEIMIVRRNCEALSETSRYFTQRGVRPEFSFRSHNDDRVLAMVRCGLGVTVAPRSHRAKGLVLRPLEGFDPRREIGVVFGPHVDDLREVAAAVVAVARDLA